MRPINLGIFAAIVLALVCLINIGNQAKGSEYYEAVVGHVIQNADKIDHSQLLNDEIAKLAHSFSIEILSSLQSHLPNIIEGVITDMKMKSDNKYKCSITECE
tara:strand:- start:759 stop:1067 length:309 start_codon:yes stop_codon:yes gene_type:complete